MNDLNLEPEDFENRARDMVKSYKEKRAKALGSLNSRNLSSQEYYGHDPTMVKKLETKYKQKLLADITPNNSTFK